MAADNADHFTKVGTPGTATTLDAPGHTIGEDSITVVSTSNWPTDTGVIFAMDTVSLVNGVETRDPGSYTEWEGIVSDATTISSMVLREGTDQNYPAGSTTRVYIPVSSARENRLVEGVLVAHNQDGTHKSGAVYDDPEFTGTPTFPDAFIPVDAMDSNADEGSVATAEDTSSTSFTDLATVTDEVTVDVPASGKVLVSVRCDLANNTAGDGSFVGVAMSGANTEAAGTNPRRQLFLDAHNNHFDFRSLTYVAKGLSPGSTTFKLKYKVTSGATVGSFGNRQISVVPL